MKILGLSSSFEPDHKRSLLAKMGQPTFLEKSWHTLRHFIHYIVHA